MIQGESTGIVIKLREYLASLKMPTQKAPQEVIIEVLMMLLPSIEELQRIQWRNNQLSTGELMGDYSPLTIKRYNKRQSKINLKETGELYDSVSATIDLSTDDMFKIEIDSPRYERDYINLGFNSKIGFKENGEPKFLGLTPENTSFIMTMFYEELRKRGYTL